MTPGTYDLILYRGDTEKRSVELFSDDAGLVPYDLTGAVAAAEIREKTAGTHIVDLDVDITLPNKILVSMDPDNYATCPATGIWDLQITTVDGDVLTPLRGAVKVTPDVTDSLVMPAARR